jgi:recombination protein RecA
MAKKQEEKEEQDSLELALKSIEKDFGAGSVIADGSFVNIPRQKTGSLGLDIITGGGWGVGKMVELVAPEATGKTSLCIHTMIQAQKDQPKRRVVMIDMEHAFDKYYAQNLGLDTDKLLIAQPSHAEEALEIAERLISSGKVSVCVVDSVASLVPKAEVEGEMGDNQMGLQARLMSKACRKLTGIVNKTGTVLMWTNQIREKIGVMYGSNETTPGGNALKFFASTRVDMRKKMGEKTKDGSVHYNKVTLKTIKNKLAPPFQETKFDIVFGEGIDLISELVYYGVKSGVLSLNGSWYSYEDVKLGQGEPAAKEILRDNPELCEEIEAKIRDVYEI